MTHRLLALFPLSFLALLAIITLLIAPLPTISPELQAATPADAGLVPLPGGCGGANPPGAGETVCCMYGYVFVDGQAIVGAKVTISNSNGSVVVWTETGPDSVQPYYQLSLSDPPLQARPGETISIVAEYGSQRRSLTHAVLGAGQQVDLVLPGEPGADFVAGEQYWQPTSLGSFNIP